MGKASHDKRATIGTVLCIIGLTIGIGGFLIRLGQSSAVQNIPPELSSIRATVPNVSGDLANLGIAIWDGPLMRGVAIGMMLSGLLCFGLGHRLRGRSGSD